MCYEESEYAEADIITVPSTFALKSFEAMGVPTSKMRLVPYGVDTARFRPVSQPRADTFDVLFAGSVTLEKGIPYLVAAFDRVDHPKKGCGSLVQ